MSEAKKTMQENIRIEASELLAVMQDHNSSGYRLVQACGANTKDGTEVWYSLDNGDYVLKNLILSVPDDNSLQSITNIYWYGFIYENEIHDLFGIKFKNSKMDYGGHFFRISEETPWNSKAEREVGENE